MPPLITTIIWHPHTELPARAWTPAIIAVRCDREPLDGPALIVLPQLYSCRGGQWETDLDGKPLVAPEGFWWASEADLVAPLALLVQLREYAHG